MFVVVVKKLAARSGLGEFIDRNTQGESGNHALGENRALRVAGV